MTSSDQLFLMVYDQISPRTTQHKPGLPPGLDMHTLAKRRCGTCPCHVQLRTVKLRKRHGKRQMRIIGSHSNCGIPCPSVETVEFGHCCSVMPGPYKGNDNEIS